MRQARLNDYPAGKAVLYELTAERVRIPGSLRRCDSRKMSDKFSEYDLGTVRIGYPDSAQELVRFFCSWPDQPLGDTVAIRGTAVSVDWPTGGGLRAIREEVSSLG